MNHIGSAEVYRPHLPGVARVDRLKVRQSSRRSAFPPCPPARTPRPVSRTELCGSQNSVPVDLSTASPSSRALGPNSVPAAITSTRVRVSPPGTSASSRESVTATVAGRTSAAPADRGTGPTAEGWRPGVFWLVGRDRDQSAPRAGAAAGARDQSPAPGREAAPLTRGRAARCSVPARWGTAARAARASSRCPCRFCSIVVGRRRGRACDSPTAFGIVGA